MQTSTNNNHAFSAPRHKPEADRSWWLSLESREAFQAAIEREATRMQRSEMAKRVRGIIVGHLG